MASRGGRHNATDAAPAEGLWMEYAGMVESGDPDSSQNIDAVVYGHD